MKKLLLISNSYSFGRNYLDHAEEAIIDFLENTKPILFIPYAMKDYDKYYSIFQDRISKMGFKCESIHLFQNPREAITKAHSYFVLGGNTFRLIKTLQEYDLIEPIRKKIEDRTPYIGTSAGTVIVAPTIKTTNDMPIIYPKNFDGLDLINFQINAHYIDADPNSTHKGETREQRIADYFQDNDVPVLGLYEDSWLVIDGEKIKLDGKNGAKLFTKTNSPQVFSNGFIEIPRL